MSTTIMSISAAVGGAAVGGFTGWVPLPDDAGCRFNYAEGGLHSFHSVHRTMVHDISTFRMNNSTGT